MIHGAFTYQNLQFKMYKRPMIGLRHVSSYHNNSIEETYIITISALRTILFSMAFNSSADRLRMFSGIGLVYFASTPRSSTTTSSLGSSKLDLGEGGIGGRVVVGDVIFDG